MGTRAGTRVALTSLLIGRVFAQAAAEACPTPSYPREPRH